MQDFTMEYFYIVVLVPELRVSQKIYLPLVDFGFTAKILFVKHQTLSLHSM